MAYVSQELKSKIAPKVKAICKEYGVKASVAVKHHSTLVLNIQSGIIDFIGNYNEIVSKKPNPYPNQTVDCRIAKNYIQVNEYHLESDYSGAALAFLLAVRSAMNEENFDNSDVQTDYFHVGWYIDINIGKYDKPYTCGQ